MEKCGNLDDMVTVLAAHVNKILRENLYEMNLDKVRLERLIRQKQELRENIGRCGIGDDLSKTYVLEFIQECLLKLYSFNESNIDELFYFKREDNAEYLFDRLLYRYRSDHGKNGFEIMMDDLEEIKNPDGASNEVSADDIMALYRGRSIKFSFTQKMELISQKVYSAYKGLGVIDELRDMNIDGVSGGVSGSEGEYNSCWIFYRGRSIHLSFLDFGSEEEIERICRNMCRFRQPGEISRKKGYMIHEMKDHSRVVVARPDFAESWMFFVRKLDQGKKRSLEEIAGDYEGAGIVVKLLKWLMKGCQVVGVTGMQGCGKTTLLMALIDEVPGEYTIRVLELAFELHLRQLYPDRNIVTFRETGDVDGFEGLEVQKKTDGAVSVIGEVAGARVAAWMVESGQTGSLFTLFTHHARNTGALVSSLRNALLKEGSFSNENVATEQVVRVVHFDVHLHLDRNGRRYIERITQIRESGEGIGSYVTEDLVVFEKPVDGTAPHYIQKHHIAEEYRSDMRNWMTDEEREAFDVAGI